VHITEVFRQHVEGSHVFYKNEFRLFNFIKKVPFTYWVRVHATGWRHDLRERTLKVSEDQLCCISCDLLIRHHAQCEDVLSWNPDFLVVVYEATPKIVFQRKILTSMIKLIRRRNVQTTSCDHISSSKRVCRPFSAIYANELNRPQNINSFK